MTEEERDLFVEPMRMWRNWYQKSEQQWSEAITEIMADERMGKRFGKYFQEWLHAHHMFTEMVGQQLASLNLPSRNDLLNVGDRMGEVEDSLSALTAEIHQLKKQLARSTQAGNVEAGATAPVRRTRKPPVKGGAKTRIKTANKASASEATSGEPAGDSE